MARPKKTTRGSSGNGDGARSGDTDADGTDTKGSSVDSAASPDRKTETAPETPDAMTRETGAPKPESGDDAMDARGGGVEADKAAVQATDPEDSRGSADAAGAATPGRPDPKADHRQQTADDAKGDAAGGGGAGGSDRAGTAAPAAAAPRRGVLPLVLGGVLAAVIGFGLSHYVVPDGWPITFEDERVGGLEGSLQTANDRIDGLAGDLDALAEQIGPLPDDVASARDLAADAADRAEMLDARLQESEERIAALPELQSALEATQEQLRELERRPLTATDAAEEAIAAYDAELAELRDTVAEQEERIGSLSGEVDTLSEQMQSAIEAARTEAEEARAQADQVERDTAARAALTRIEAALERGEAYGPALDRLSEAGVDVPEALGAGAQGVTPLARLQDDFPAAARAALTAAVADLAPEQGIAARAETFLRGQLGVRSLSPREGDAPDAVLSRAEAALRGGDLPAALDTLQALPPASRSAMEDWESAAQAHVAARNAFAELDARLDTPEDTAE